jgi:regulatory protein
LALIRKPLSLKARALQALALREHSRSELRQKLLRGSQAQARAQGRTRVRGEAAASGLEPDDVVAGTGIDPNADPSADPSTDHSAEVEAVLDDLQARGLLSEERFIESRVHARSGRFGNRRIQAELAQHGLALDPHTAAELRRTELDRARDVWNRRFARSGNEPPTDAAEVARQMRFLAARGFSADVIRRVIKGHNSEE